MVAKPLSCTHCGAGDVQEVKPDTYFCNYCEQVFKWIEPGRVKVEGMALGCEIRLQSGVVCGVSAHARCVHCDRAICKQHTGYELFTATCHDCDTSDRAEEQRRENAWKSARKSLDLTSAERLVLFEVRHVKKTVRKRRWWGDIEIRTTGFEDEWEKVGHGVSLGHLIAPDRPESVLVTDVDPGGDQDRYRDYIPRHNPDLVYNRIYSVKPGRAGNERVVIDEGDPWRDSQFFDAVMVALNQFKDTQRHT